MEYNFSERIKGLKPSIIREIFKFTADPEVIAFSAGNPAPEAFPAKEIAKISAEVLEKTPVKALQYNITEGYYPLREALKERLAKKYGIGRDFDELIVVSGAQQGIYLTTKVLCNEGDTVICESPSFIGSLNAFRSYGLKLCGIEVEEDGINIEALERALKQQKNVKMIYTIPNFQNPSGVTMSLEKRRAMLALAKKYNVIILEDNPYGDLRFEGEHVASIKSMDEDGVVVYCGTFSKVLSPGMRVGYVSAPAEIVSKIVVAKQVSDVHTNILAQIVAKRYMTEFDFDGHIERISKMYGERCSFMAKQIDKFLAPQVRYVKPQGGLFIWCDLPEGVDMLDFCRRAVKNKVAVVPGSAFMMSESEPCGSFRLNFSTPSMEQIEKGVEILGKVLKEML